jgi:hypothetical protein
MVRSRDTSQVFNTSSTKSPEKKKISSTNEDAELEKEIINGFRGGLEHNRQLADVLFERWCEGLRARWPAV